MGKEKTQQEKEWLELIINVLKEKITVTLRLRDEYGSEFADRYVQALKYAKMVLQEKLEEVGK